MCGRKWQARDSSFQLNSLKNEKRGILTTGVDFAPAFFQAAALMPREGAAWGVGFVFHGGGV